MTLRYQVPMDAVLIDDDIEFCAQMRRFLRPLGVELTSTEKTTEFMEIIKRLRPRFILIDLNINAINDGLALVQHVRQKLGPEAFIFVVSAEVGFQTTTRALKSGVTDYITKPIDRLILKEKLSYYLKDDIAQNTKIEYRTPSLSPLAIQIEFAGIIEGVDEFGVRIRSSHLLSKGSLIKISGEMIEDITGAKSVLVTVISQNREPKSNSFVHYTEYETSSKEILNNVRKWLSSRVESTS